MGGEGGREIVKRSALRLEADLISRLPAKIPSTDVYYARIVSEYCAKIGHFIIFISVESYNGELKALVFKKLGQTDGTTAILYNFQKHLSIFCQHGFINTTFRQSAESTNRIHY